MQLASKSSQTWTSLVFKLQVPLKAALQTNTQIWTDYWTQSYQVRNYKLFQRTKHIKHKGSSLSFDVQSSVRHKTSAGILTQLSFISSCWYNMERSVKERHKISPSLFVTQNRPKLAYNAARTESNCNKQEVLFNVLISIAL